MQKVNYSETSSELIEGWSYSKLSKGLSKKNYIFLKINLGIFNAITFNCT